LGSVTVTLTDDLIVEAYDERAVMVAAPAFLAVTTPLELTVATVLLLEDHLSVFTAVDGATDAVTLEVLPLLRAMVVELNVILVGLFGSTLAAYTVIVGTN
jgi:hypothetical protein